jgi:1,2-phenylacetyl-CoA epoxidase PaaB subunit
MTVPVEPAVYEVFARIAPGDPLCHIGNVNAPADDLARIYALKLYDEEDWAEFWVVPRRAIAVSRPMRLVPPEGS